MMDNFITWDVLVNYTTFVSIVYMVVEFTKTLPLVKKIPTKYWSFITSFVLIIMTNLAVGSFVAKNILLYSLSSIAISLSANGLSDFNKGDGK
jgi:hypothetical protein